MVSPAPARTPIHLWIVGVLSLLWNLFGAYDYVMSLTQGEAYFRASGMSEAAIAYYNAMPAWIYIPWTLGIGGALLGSILLLLRSRFAVHAFAVSLFGSVVSNLAALLLSNGAMTEGGMAIVPAIIFLICVALLVYAIWMRRRGVLR